MTDDFEQALKQSLRLLASSERFEGDLRRRLAGYSPSTTDAVIAHLKSKGMLSEQRAAEAWVRARSGKRAVSRDRMRTDLESKGVDAAVADAILPDEGSDREQVKSLLARRFEGHGDRARAGRFLLSRGFDADLIESEIDRFFGET